MRDNLADIGISLGFLLMGMASVVLMASIMKQPQKQERISG
ncbi:hypothetical protein [Lentibacillus amyloliquefaciens]|nr:hypothetical protein [Lentibacillus amyloliquefaciens]